MRKVKIIALVTVLILALTGCTMPDILKSDSGIKSSTAETGEGELEREMDLVAEKDMLKILEKKGRGDRLEEYEANLIEYYSIQPDGRGVAWVDVHGIGMGKAVGQLYRTENNGETWTAVDRDMLFANGEWNCTYIGDKVIIANHNSTVLDSNFMFYTDNQDDFEFITAREVLQLGDDLEHVNLIPEKLFENQKTQRVIYAWRRGDYLNTDYVLVAEYDSDLKMTNEIYRDYAAFKAECWKEESEYIIK